MIYEPRFCHLQFDQSNFSKWHNDSCVRIYAPINCYLINISLKFHKDLSFPWGDIALFVTLYNLDVKIFGVFFILNYSQKLTKYLHPRNGQPNYFIWLSWLEACDWKNKKKRLRNPTFIGFTRVMRLDMIWGKSPELFNGGVLLGNINHMSKLL